MLRLKTSPPGYEYREENRGIEKIRVSLTKVKQWHPIMVERETLAY